ncbi:MAG: prepilin-type N-terminal cleavage/methylation domain-containing protein [Planctomycetota bacterium]
MTTMMRQTGIVRARRAFTLTELLVAIVVLLVVIAATSKIFGTASRITAVATANASLIQTVSAVQAQLRRDIDSYNDDGLFMIRNLAVRNDAYGPNAPLINPVLKPDEWIRCDQLVFFRSGIQGMTTFALAGDTQLKSSSNESVIIYSPGFQIPEGRGATPSSPGSFIYTVYDALGPTGNVNAQIYPFNRQDIEMVRTTFRPINSGGADNESTTMYSASSSDTLNGVQPESRRWILCRQSVIGGDDDTQDELNPNQDGKAFYMKNRGAKSIFFNDPWGPNDSTFASRQIRDGRFDLSATMVHDVRDRLIEESDDWQVQRLLFEREVMRYPRAERSAPSIRRVDQALTNHVMSPNCSDFRVDWTYRKGSGAIFDTNGVQLHSGVQYGEVLVNGSWQGANSLNESELSQPWFGWFDEDRGVMPFTVGDTWGSVPAWWNGDAPWWTSQNLINNADFEFSIFANNIEIFDDPMPSQAGTVFGVNDAKQYLASFGYNRTQPSTIGPDGRLVPTSVETAYTPWPDAVRVRMTLHDEDLNLEYGRTFEFVVDLPEREND